MSQSRFTRTAGAGLAALVALLLLAGCARDRAVRVVPLGNQTVAALTADDVARILRRAGFGHEQIVEMGTDVRNALSTTGAAKVRVGEKVEAIFAVNGHSIQGTSRRRGSFSYDFEANEFD